MIRGLYGRDMDDEAVFALMSVAPEYIAAAHDAIRARHGSFDTYLEDVLDVGPEQQAAIRATLLA